MESELEERYVFWRLAHADFQECFDFLNLVEAVDHKKAKLALVKAAIIAYGRPFSGNASLFREQKWKVNKDWVPDKLTHELVLGWRDSLVAHTDIPFRQPILSRKKYSIRLKGVYYEDFMGQVDPLKNLSSMMIDILDKKMADYTKERFED